MNEIDDVAVVVGRHTEEPLIEGGGIIARQIAKALSRLGIQTWLVSINYSKSAMFPKIEIFEKNTENKITLKIYFLSQDDVLNNPHCMILSNFVELTTTPVLAIRLLRKLRNNYRNIYLFIVNANKIIGKFFAYIFKHSSRTTKIYVLTRREELYRKTLRLLNPDIILTTSKELQLLALKSAIPSVKTVIFAYPPMLDLNELKLELEKPIDKEPILLYLGRVNNRRFPITFFKNIAMKLEKSPREFKFVIVIPPEKSSMAWLSDAKNVVREYNLTNRIIFIPRVLQKFEKNMLLKKASIFIYPSILTAATEPPLSVLEAMSYGQYLITTGSTSTRELVIQTKGFISRDFSDLSNLEDHFYIANQSRETILSWSKDNLNVIKFMNTIRKVISC